MTVSTESPNAPLEKFYAPIEIAALLGVQRRTVVSWLKNPKHPLKGTKIGNNTWRVAESDYVSFLKERYGNQASTA